MNTEDKSFFDRAGRLVDLAVTMYGDTPPAKRNEQIRELAPKIIADVLALALATSGDLRTVLEGSIDALRRLGVEPIEPDTATATALKATHYLIGRGWGQRARADERGRVFVEAAVALAGIDDEYTDKHDDEVAETWLPLILADCFALGERIEFKLSELLEQSLKQHNTT